MNSTILLSVLLFAGTGQSPCQTYSATPQLIMSEIRARGTGVVLQELYFSWAWGATTENGTPRFDCWNPVLEHISGGSRQWLDVAVQLLQKSDAGAAQMLLQAIDDALDTHPSNVLKVVPKMPPPLTVENLCGAQIPVWAATETTARTAIKCRRTSVSRVSDPHLTAIKTQCLALLTEVEKELPRLYRPAPPD